MHAIQADWSLRLALPPLFYSTSVASPRGGICPGRVVDEDLAEGGRVGRCVPGWQCSARAGTQVASARTALSQMLCSFLHIGHQSSSAAFWFVKKGKRCQTCFFSTFIFLLYQTRCTHRVSMIQGSRIQDTLLRRVTRGCLLSYFSALNLGRLRYLIKTKIPILGPPAVKN